MNKASYQGSDEHKINAKEAQKKGLEAIKQKTVKKKEDYYKNPKLCKNCFGVIDYDKKRTNSFCCHSCSATFTNKQRGAHTKETNKKISKKLSGRKLSEEHKEKLRGNKNGCNNVSVFLNKTEDEILEIKKNRSDVIKKFYQNNPEARKRQSDNALNRKPASMETRKKLSDSVNERVKLGLHKGWSSRNKPSYPELFFMEVLKNNKIDYEFEKKEGIYFIDFAINNKKIALEIDGAQHKLQERKESDVKKDIFLKDNGWIVYRIAWKSINTISGKEYIKNEIDKFIYFYNN